MNLELIMTDIYGRCKQSHSVWRSGYNPGYTQHLILEFDGYDIDVTSDFYVGDIVIQNLLILKMQQIFLMYGKKVIIQLGKILKMHLQMN